MNKRILIATGIYPPEIGGPATYLPQFIEFIKNNNWDFKVITFADSNAKEGNIFRISRKSNILKRFLKYLFCILKNIKDVDIVYLHDSSISGLAVFLASFLFNKKYILRMGGDFVWEQAYQSHKTNLKYFDFQKSKTPKGFKLKRFITKTVSRGAVKIVVPSNFLKNNVILWGINPSKIEVVYNAISDSIIKDNISDVYNKIRNYKDRNYKIFVSNGRFINWKKFDYLIEIFQDIDNAKLFIIGGGPEKNNLENLILKYKLENKVFLIEKVKRNELLKIYEICDAFILLSIGDTFSFSCLEALLCGLRLIISKEGAFEEIFGEFDSKGVKFVDLDDKNDIIHIINNIDSVYKIQEIEIEYLKNKYNYKKHLDSVYNIILENIKK